MGVVWERDLHYRYVPNGHVLGIIYYHIGAGAKADVRWNVHAMKTENCVAQNENFLLTTTVHIICLSSIKEISELGKGR